MNAETPSAHRRRGPASTLCLPVERWPEADQRAWEVALKPGDCFEPGGAAFGWSPSRLRQVRKGYGRYLRWLSDQGMLDPCVTPADRVTKNRVNAYLAELRQVNAGFTIPDRIQELGDAMRALAPHEDWSWMLRAAGRLRAITIPAKDKRARIRPIDELVQLGLSLMAEAEQNGSLTKLQRALAFRDGLLIAFLSFHPIRLKNLSTLEYGRHVTARGNRFWLSIAANEMKNRRPFECEIAERLIEPIRRYLEHYRPLLLGRHAGTHPSAFWVSGNGSRLCAGRIQTIVRRRTGDVGMLPISPHLFRSCAATAVAINRPELVDIIPGVLSHATRKTSEESYNMAGMIEASRAHADLIGQLGQNE